MKNRLTQEWWNCFNAFAIEILEKDPNSVTLETVLKGAGVSKKEIRKAIESYGGYEYVQHWLINYANKLDNKSN